MTAVRYARAMADGVRAVGLARRFTAERMLLLGALGLMACPKAPERYRALHEGHVTTKVTVSCPGQPAQTAFNAVTLVACDGQGMSGNDVFAFAWQGSPVQCVEDATGSPSEFSDCTPGWFLHDTTFVAEAYPFADAYESYTSGSLATPDGGSCAVEISGPIYRQDIDITPYCPCLYGALTDAGCPAADAGPAKVADGGA
jgi:hypothetical protein